MKELLRDQAKFRERLERVVRKIETSSERTAKLADRRKGRGKNGASPAAEAPGGNGEQHGEKDHGDGAEMAGSSPRREAITLSPEKDSL